MRNPRSFCNKSVVQVPLASAVHNIVYGLPPVLAVVEAKNGGEARFPAIISVAFRSIVSPRTVL